MRLVTALLALLALPALAADTVPGQAEVLGFTPSGSVAVLLEHGVQDGTGFPWARATFYEVKKQRMVDQPLEVRLETPDATEAQAIDKVKALADEKRQKLKLEKFVPGKHIARDEKGQLFDSEGAPIGSIEVKTRKFGGKAPKVCDAPFKPILVTVKMIWMDDDKPQTLLADKATPKDRACLIDCEFDQVFALNQSVLVTLKCDAPGFEGAQKQTVAVPVWTRYGLDVDYEALGAQQAAQDAAKAQAAPAAGGAAAGAASSTQAAPAPAAPK
ncbi:MAG: DUF2259 domain-containing protein [Deltaproteobacteria bacterium]|nr:DUF2259 domain-containing protein [Deltaproteobacteria bacterium]